jgi:UDP-N-acetylmuramoyl-tripeptide--D-alanyl-D-alanine ligase
VEDLGLDGSRARVTTPSGAVAVTTPLVGRGHLANVLAAVATATRFDVPLEAIAARAATLRPAAHRGEVLRLPGGVSVVDDSYNSSPSALAAALALVGGARGSARRVAFLGEMLELGAHAAPLHAESGARAAAAGLDLLVTIGGAPARALGEAARAAGLPAGAVRHVESSAEAADLVPALVRAGDLVLVKGSRGVATDRVVDRLKAEFA